MNYFSWPYFIYMGIISVILISFYFIFKNKSDKTKFIATYIPLILGFIVHFLKLLIPEYKEALPYSLCYITPGTICAVSTLAFPFIYISKSTILKDYMVVLGIIAGTLSLVIPANTSGYAPFNIEVIRYYFAHTTLILSPLFTLIFKIHTPSKKWIKNTLIIFILVCLIVGIDNTIWMYINEDSAILDLFNNLTN